MEMLSCQHTKKIAWESWNAMMQDIEHSSLPMIDIGDEETTPSFEQLEKSAEINEIFIQHPKFVYTPLGIYPAESTFKPSDRWGIVGLRILILVSLQI